MRVLVDTNILLRSAQPTHPLNVQATNAVSKLIRANTAVFFCVKWFGRSTVSNAC
jgi:hypothetical protein